MQRGEIAECYACGRLAKIALLKEIFKVRFLRMVRNFKFIPFCKSEHKQFCRLIPLLYTHRVFPRLTSATQIHVIVQVTPFWLVRTITLVFAIGSVYTNAVSLTASFSMRLSLVFTWHRSRTSAKRGRFEKAAKRGMFTKQYGFICRINSETASIWIRLLLWREIRIVRFKMVNSARTRSAAIAYIYYHDFDFLAKMVPCKHF